MLKTTLSHSDIAQLVEQLVLSAAILGWSPAAAGLFGSPRAKDLETTSIETSHICQRFCRITAFTEFK
jgi:hypothetical protein